MAVFEYKVLQSDGHLKLGELDADNRQDALGILDAKGWQPLLLQEKDGRSSRVTKENLEIEGPIKLKRSQVILFTEELSDLLEGGLQLEPALKIMENRDELSALKIVTQSIRKKVRDGASFAKALESSSPSFGELYCNLAAAGEVSGALSTILKRQSEYLVNLQELRNKVISSLIYPSFLIVAGIAVTILFITMLIPQLEDLLQGSGKNLPLGAQVIMGMSTFLAKWWWAFILVITMAILGAKHYVEQQENRESWGRFQLNIPLVGKILESRFYVHLLETLSNLVGNGLPLLKSLELARDATLNLHLKKILERVIRYVADGSALSRAMKRAEFFPPLLTDMLAVGEQTGRIEEALARAAHRYDKELSKKAQKMTALIQPLIVVAMTIVIGLMAYVMITSIFQTMSRL